MVIDFIMRNISKQAHVINKLGRFGTAVALAPVLLFELYLAINYSSASHSSLGIPLLYELLISKQGDLCYTIYVSNRR